MVKKNLRNVKLGFLIFVGMLVAIALFYSFKSGGEEEDAKAVDDEIVSDEEQVDVNKDELKEIEEKYNNNTNQETNNDKKQKKKKMYLKMKKWSRMISLLFIMKNLERRK